MSEITIKIEDYLNEEDIREACMSACKLFVAQLLERQKDLTVMLQNAAYGIATEYVSKNLGEDAELLISKQVHEIISELSTYTVFRQGSYGDKDSNGWIYLQQAVADNQELIEERVKTIISESGASEVQKAIKSRVDDAIDSWNRIAEILDETVK